MKSLVVVKGLNRPNITLMISSNAELVGINDRVDPRLLLWRFVGMFLLFESIANLLNVRKDLLGQMLDTISKERVFERCEMASNQEGKQKKTIAGQKWL